jgi:5'-methylthioadenosine phosphorylase
MALSKGNPIKIGIIGGTGLDDPDILEDRREEVVETIFGAPSDALILGKIGGVECVLLARHGRKHNISPTNVNYRANIWALKNAGCSHIIVSTACGSLKEEVQPGDFVFLDNFIDRTTKRVQTFYDGSTPGAPPGILHLPMEPVFSEELRQVLISTAEELGISHHKTGTCVTIEGPRFSTKAESNLYRSWGASVVNMTCVPESVLAKEAGLLYAAVAMATDYDCWRDSGEKVSVEGVMRTFKANSQKVRELFKAAVPRIAGIPWEEHVEGLQGLLLGSTML